MPEIGECYSISEVLPEGNKVKDIKFTDKALKFIIKGVLNLSILKNTKMLKPFSYGKSVLIPLESNSNKYILCSQLGMTGSWFMNDAYKERGSDHVLIKTENYLLRYSDPRMFGKIKIYEGNDFEEILSNIIKEKKWGIDPIKAEIKEIQSQLLKLQTKKVNIKSKLLEQNLIFGIGNYLASEVLFDSKISPLRKCSDISVSEYLTLAKSIKKICTLAKNKKGYSFAGGYILPDGSYGNMKDYIKMYGKEECCKCSGKVTVKYINTRVTYFCKNCQK